MLLSKKVIGTIGYMGGVMAIPEPFVWSWSQMIEYNNDYLLNPGEQILYTRTTNSYHSFARNNLVTAMRGDWLLMLDTDHQFDPDLASRLLRWFYAEPDIDIITGIYQYKGAPYSPKIYRFTKDMTSIEAIGNWEKIKDKRYLTEIDSAGGGCLLVRKRVFNMIKSRFKVDPFDIHMPFSEDNSFFYRVKKLGIKVYCDTTIEYPHLSYQRITLDMYNPKSLSLKKYKINS